MPNAPTKILTWQMVRPSVRDKETGLIDYTWNALSEIDDVTLYGPAPADTPRTGTIAFNIKGFDHGLTAAALNCVSTNGNGDCFGVSVERIHCITSI